jgi:hypothetical protein
MIETTTGLFFSFHCTLEGILPVAEPRHLTLYAGVEAPTVIRLNKSKMRAFIELMVRDVTRFVYM